VDKGKKKNNLTLTETRAGGVMSRCQHTPRGEPGKKESGSKKTVLYRGRLKKISLVDRKNLSK